MDTTAAPYKLFVRVGNHEFKAIGPQEAVKDQFDLFMGVLGSVPGAIPRSNGSEKPPAEEIDKDLPGDYHKQFAPAGNGKAITKELLQRAFRLDGKSLSLSMLPPVSKERQSAAILLLVYGYHALQGQKEIGAYALTASARQSGVMVGRVDRTLLKMPNFIMRGGSGNATRYSITNPGIAQAEKLLAEMYLR